MFASIKPVCIFVSQSGTKKTNCRRKKTIHVMKKEIISNALNAKGANGNGNGKGHTNGNGNKAAATDTKAATKKAATKSAAAATTDTKATAAKKPAETKAAAPALKPDVKFLFNGGKYIVRDAGKTGMNFIYVNKDGVEDYVGKVTEDTKAHYAVSRTHRGVPMTGIISKKDIQVVAKFK